MPSTIEDIKIYCFSGFVKHASLVNAVYPTKAGEEGPRPSQLSYLMYYAQHRTEKLAKVGKFLQKRFSWDAAKDKRAFHRVTLEILNSLIDTCHANLSYFAKPLISILNEMFELGDSSLLPDLTVTVNLFIHSFFFLLF
ncbi:plasma membrane localization protein [Coelomomyces lativittatus]|nr:plasma membrane localization protein [Coelomomyces lativittatus]